MAIPSSKTAPSSSSHIAQTLLNRAHSPTTAESIFTSKVRQKPLLLNPTTSSTSTNNNARTHRRLTRLRKKQHFLRTQKPRPLSAREKRSLGVYTIPPSERRYEVYTQLHALWVGYMQDLLGLVDQRKQHEAKKKKNVTITPANHGTFLATADYHGALLEVVRCRCVDRVGITGIVVRDTKFTFVMITRAGEIKTVPKGDGAVFAFEVPLPVSGSKSGEGNGVGEGKGEEEGEGNGEKKGDSEHQGKPESLRFELHGERFQFRPADRANKKFKWQSLEGL